MKIRENEKCLDSSGTIGRKEVNEDWIGIFDSLGKEINKENEECLDSSGTIGRKEVNEDWIGIFDSLGKEINKETFIGGKKI